MNTHALKKASVFNPNDNVATALSDLEYNNIITVQIGEKSREITLKQAIPFGHKFAICHIDKGNNVVKYGIVIGRSNKEIRIGEHVHIHNVESLQTPVIRKIKESQ
jgi:altronate dehydratase small subunit